jgi:hypothetical protein
MSSVGKRGQWMMRVERWRNFWKFKNPFIFGAFVGIDSKRNEGCLMKNACIEKNWRELFVSKLPHKSVRRKVDT